ncbi:carboxymuconolactone decarboxylase family protein, partial [Mycobacterium avium]|uniref:carboxymuconolactone decarboxylase family protein n=1 Tax=Mycobacterium avium TaxID=1764 RepID=UPI001F3EB127
HNRRHRSQPYTTAGSPTVIKVRLRSPVLPRRLRELIVLRTASAMDCAYELGQHRDVARTVGLDPATIDAVISETGWQASDLTPTELAVLHLTTELVTTRRVAPPLFDRVHRALGTEATVEALMMINRYAGLALMLNALEVDLDETARLPIPPTS